MEDGSTRNGRVLTTFEEEMLGRIERIEERLQIGREPARSHALDWPPPAYIHEPLGAIHPWDIAPGKAEGDDANKT